MDADNLTARERPGRRRAIERVSFVVPAQDIPLAKALAMTSATAAISRSQRREPEPSCRQDQPERPMTIPRREDRRRHRSDRSALRLPELRGRTYPRIRPRSPRSLRGRRPTPIRLWMAFVLRRAIAGRLRIRLAHVGPVLRCAVVVGSSEVVDARFSVHPDNGIGRAMGARLLVGRELAPAGCRWRWAIRCWGWSSARVLRLVQRVASWATVNL